MARHRYILFTKGRKDTPKYIAIEPKLHAMVRAYAQERNTTIIEAAYILLGKALAQEVGLSDEVSKVLDKERG